MIQRIRDWRLERRIRRLGDAMLFAVTSGDKVKARAIQSDWMDAINARSPGQVARMDLALRKRVGIA